MSWRVLTIYQIMKKHQTFILLVILTSEKCKLLKQWTDFKTGALKFEVLYVLNHSAVFW
jgi:hypothetical protein